ncbi:MAG: TonB family protein, partial [Desulfuromonadaceae bacterium]
GTQAGVDFNEWIKGYLMEHWTLPRTHWKKELYSVVELRFGPQGERRGFRMIRSSGDPYFDQSVEKAVTELDKLPSPPGKELSLSVKFDPEEKY